MENQSLCGCGAPEGGAGFSGGCLAALPTPPPANPSPPRLQAGPLSRAKATVSKATMALARFPLRKGPCLPPAQVTMTNGGQLTPALGVRGHPRAPTARQHRGSGWRPAGWRVMPMRGGGGAGSILSLGSPSPFPESRGRSGLGQSHLHCWGPEGNAGFEPIHPRTGPCGICPPHGS